MKTIEEMIHEKSIEMAPENRPEDAQKYEKMLRKVLLEGMAPKEAMNIDESTVDVIYDYASNLYNSGNYKSAILLFGFLTLLDPKEPKYRFCHAASQHMNKQYADAIESYASCIPLDPKNPAPAYHAADCYIKLNRPLEATNYLHTAIAQAQTDPKKYRVMMERALLTMQTLSTQIQKLMTSAEEKEQKK